MTLLLVLNLGVCLVGLLWDLRVSPLMDDSDPAAYAGVGLLLFGVPAVTLQTLALLARMIPRPWTTALPFGVSIPVLTLDMILVAGLLSWMLLVGSNPERMWHDLARIWAD